MSDDPQNNNSCSMVGFLGIMIQIGLGALSFSVLIVKRYFQNPKRPWKIWTFDASKQMISQLIAHFINLTISLALTYDRKNSDQCLWYFVTNVFDNTMGVFICIVLLKLVQNNLKKRRKFELISGNYYKKIDPLSLTHQTQKLSQQHKNSSIKQHKLNNQAIEVELKNGNKQAFISEGDSRLHALSNSNNISKQISEKINSTNTEPEDSFVYIIDYKAWIIQLGIWNGIVIIAKCALFGLQFGLQKQLQDLSMFILGWIQEYPVLQLLVVIVFVPVVMNGLAYWVQDNFLMKHQRQPQQKNLIEENLKQNRHFQDQIANNQVIRPNQPIHFQNQNNCPRKTSQFQSQGNRFQFHDDYDARDEQNPAQKFDNFDKFGKFAL